MKLDALTDRPSKLRRHTGAVRDNQIEVALIILYLAGYEVELNDTGTPRASAAKEALCELDKQDQINVYSTSTTSGGIWQTWQRDALKNGDLDTTRSWSVWNKGLHREA